MTARSARADLRSPRMQDAARFLQGSARSAGQRCGIRDFVRLRRRAEIKQSLECRHHATTFGCQRDALVAAIHDVFLSDKDVEPWHSLTMGLAKGSDVPRHGADRMARDVGYVGYGALRFCDDSEEFRHLLCLHLSVQLPELFYERCNLASCLGGFCLFVCQHSVPPIGPLCER